MSQQPNTTPINANAPATGTLMQLLVFLIVLNLGALGGLLYLHKQVDQKRQQLDARETEWVRDSIRKATILPPTLVPAATDTITTTRPVVNRVVSPQM
ncbi:MAG: hypothetical protein H6555_04230 [Lewinellaceae bacterium]|nr:hypothetical protein [Lewinellaceae bacterium]